MFVLLLCITTDITEESDEESTEIEYTMENWSTSDLAITMLILAVIVVILCSFLFYAGWVLFIEKSIIIIPAIIGLMLQSNFYFKRAALKIVRATSPVIKRMALNNLTTSFAVKRFIAALTTEHSVIKRLYLTGVTAVSFVVKKPYSIYLSYVLIFIDSEFLHYGIGFRTVEAAYLSMMILTASFNQFNFAGTPIRSATWVYAILFVLVPRTVVGPNRPRDYIVLCTLMFVRFIPNLRSYETVYIAVALSITTFTHDLVLSFAEIHGVVSLLLQYLLVEVSLFYFCTYLVCYSTYPEYFFG